MKHDKKFHLPPEKLQELRAEISAYFLDEFDLEIGSLQADLFLDFVQKKIGTQYYNLGVTDTIEAVKDKTEDLFLLLKTE